MSSAFDTHFCGKIYRLRKYTRIILSAFSVAVLSSSATAQDQKKKSEKSTKPLYTISKETTFVTGPLTRDGNVDFAAALNMHYSKGVTPKNNAAVLYMKAMGPEPQGKKLPRELFEMLGMEVPPTDAEHFRDLENFLNSEFGRNAVNLNKVYQNEFKAETRPWSVSEFPHIAAWLKANEKSLSFIAEGAKLKHCYCPVIPSQSIRNQPNNLAESQLPNIYIFRAFYRCLACRAMLHAGNGNVDKAFRDIMTCHRLARHVCSGPSFNSLFIGIAIDHTANETDLNLLYYTRPNSKLTLQYMKELSQLPPLPSFSDHINFEERIVFVDSYLEATFFGWHKAPVREKKKILDSIDFDIVFRTGMQNLDQVVHALKITNFRNRQEAMDKLITESKTLSNGKKMEKKWKENRISREDYSKWTGNLLTALQFPFFKRCQLLEDRAVQCHRNLLVAFALAAYKSDHDKYPTKLAELSPKYLDKIPIDLYTDKPLRYKITKNGYLLYSLGPNGMDDRGESQTEDENGTDDIAVKMPVLVN